MVTAERKKKPHSLQEKILIDKQIFVPINEIKGPTIPFFYHELTNRSPSYKRFFDLSIGVVIYLFYLILNPIIWIGLKLSQGSDVYQKFTAVTKNGYHINCKVYNTGFTQLDALNNTNNPGGFKRFLITSGLHKLPLITKVLKGDISLVGPQLFEKDFALEFSGFYTETYKRFATEPGMFSPSSYYYTDHRSVSTEELLRKDLEFVGNQAIKTYLKALY